MQHYKSTLGINERKGFFFASSDAFGNCRVWEVDRKSSIIDFKFQEEKYNEFDAGAPPPVRCMVQVRSYLIACLSYDESPGIIQVWDMLTKKDIATVEHAHKLEITGICNYFGHPGTWALNSETLGKS